MPDGTVREVELKLGHRGGTGEGPAAILVSGAFELSVIIGDGRIREVGVR